MELSIIYAPTDIQLEKRGAPMHFLDLMGWGCVAMAVVCCGMMLKSDPSMRSVDTLLATMFLMLAVGSFASAHEMKSTEWSWYHGVVGTVEVSSKYQDGRDVTFTIPGMPKEIEALANQREKDAYLCVELACRELHPGDEIYMQRKWAGREHGWLMQSIFYVDK